MTEEPEKKGVLTRALGLVFMVVITFLFALFFSIIVEWLGMYFQWWDETGSDHAKAILQSEYRWLHSEYQNNPLAQPSQLADVMVGWFDDEVVRSYIFEVIVRLIGSNSVFLEYLYAMVFVVQTMILRLTVIIMSVPALGLFMIFALIDGFVERDVRAWSGGRETSFVYHHAKSFIVPFMVIPIVLYLSAPVSVHPSIFMLIFALPTSLMVWILAKYFKKYL